MSGRMVTGGVLAVVAAAAMAGAPPATAAAVGTTACTIWFTGAVGTEWSAVGNWSPTDGGAPAGRVPTATDAVCMSTAPRTATVTLRRAAVVRAVDLPGSASVRPALALTDGARLTLAGPDASVVTDLTMGDATLAGPSPLTVTGTATATGATLGSTALTVAAGATLSVQDSVLRATTLTVDGGLTTAGDLHFVGGASLVDRGRVDVAPGPTAAGTTWHGDGSFRTDGASPLVVVDQRAPQTWHVDVPFTLGTTGYFDGSTGTTVFSRLRDVVGGVLVRGEWHSEGGPVDLGAPVSRIAVGARIASQGGAFEARLATLGAVDGSLSEDLFSSARTLQVTGELVLGGSATVGGLVVDQGGYADLSGVTVGAAGVRVRPGGAVGQLGDITGNVVNAGSWGVGRRGLFTTVHGNYTSSSTAQLSMPFTLVVTGRALLAGGVEAGTEQPAGSTTVVVEAGRVVGRFDQVSLGVGDGAVGSLVYAPTDVYLVASPLSPTP